MVSDVKGSCPALWALNAAVRDPDSVLSKPAGTSMLWKQLSWLKAS